MEMKKIKGHKEIQTIHKFQELKFYMGWMVSLSLVTRWNLMEIMIIVEIIEGEQKKGTVG